LQELSQSPKTLSPLKSAHFEQDELPGQTEGSASLFTTKAEDRPMATKKMQE